MKLEELKKLIQEVKNKKASEYQLIEEVSKFMLAKPSKKEVNALRKILKERQEKETTTPIKKENK